MPFKPNSLFVFLKTDNSFHAVEPVTDPDTKRWLLLFGIHARLLQAQNIGLAPAAAAPKPAPANVSFKF